MRVDRAVIVAGFGVVIAFLGVCSLSFAFVFVFADRQRFHALGQFHDGRLGGACLDQPLQESPRNAGR